MSTDAPPLAAIAAPIVPSQYSYSPLPAARGWIRLLRLRPHSDPSSPIQCVLFHYPLQQSSGHLYEALSYVWGDHGRALPILIGETELRVTVNLHAALTRLRNAFLERVLWIDAICINQADLEERGSQVQIMAQIYASANRVIVSLGETADRSISAFKLIRMAAEASIEGNRTFDPWRLWECRQCELWTPEYGRCATCSGKSLPTEAWAPGTETAARKFQAINLLLGRSWFRRVWVLQEVAAARRILITCGTEAINGNAFCYGLETPAFQELDLLDTIRPVLYLIKGSMARPQHEGAFSASTHLNITTLGELISMFNLHKASDLRDKVYALIGMARMDSSTSTLLPDYTIPWKVLFQRLLRTLLGHQVELETWNEREVAVVRGKACALGQVTLVRSYALSGGRQIIQVQSNGCRGYDTPSLQWGFTWTVQMPARPVLEGDIVCLVRGALYPCIVRPHGSLFSIIMIVTAEPHEFTRGDWEYDGFYGWEKGFSGPGDTWIWSRDVLMVCDWEQSEPPQSINHVYQRIGHPRKAFDLAMDLESTARMLEEYRHYQLGSEMLREALNALGDSLEEEWVRARRRLQQLRLMFKEHKAWEYVIATLHEDFNCASGRKLGRPTDSSPMTARSYPDSLEFLDYLSKNAEKVALEMTHKDDHGSLLLLFRLIGDAIPLSAAIVKGFVASANSFEILQCIFETWERGNEIEITYEMLRSAMSERWASRPGFKLLVDRRADHIAGIIRTTDICKVAAIMERLHGLRILDVFLERFDFLTQEPLSRIAELYQQAFQLDEGAVRELVAEDIDLDIPGTRSESLLVKASEYGRADLVKLLLESRRVNVNFLDRYEMTPLYLTTAAGHVEICRLLLQHGANPHTKTYYGDTPLQWMQRLDEKAGLLEVFDAVIEQQEKSAHEPVSISPAEFAEKCSVSVEETPEEEDA